jgi:Tfp pilus assembly protein PilV
VALAILSIGVVAALELFSGSLRLVDRASRRTQAVALAQELMEELFEGETIEDGEESGETAEGYSWVSAVHTVEDDDEQGRLAPRSLPLRLKALEVHVYWEGRSGMQEYTVRSLRAASERP